MNIIKKKTNKSRRELSRISYIILRTGLPVILIYLLAFLSLLLDSADIPSYVLARKYCYTLEHIIMSVTIIVVGSLTLDLAEKNYMKDKNT